MGGVEKVRPKLDEPMRTDETIDKSAGLGKNSVRQVEQMLATGSPELIAAARADEISINACAEMATLNPCRESARREQLPTAFIEGFEQERSDRDGGNVRNSARRDYAFASWSGAIWTLSLVGERLVELTRVVAKVVEHDCDKKAARKHVYNFAKPLKTFHPGKVCDEHCPKQDHRTDLEHDNGTLHNALRNRWNCIVYGSSTLMRLDSMIRAERRTGLLLKELHRAGRDRGNQHVPKSNGATQPKSEHAETPRSKLGAKPSRRRDIVRLVPQCYMVPHLYRASTGDQPAFPSTTIFSVSAISMIM
jgi:hypothetical protein